MARFPLISGLTLPLLLVAGANPAAAAEEGGVLAGRVTTDSGPLASSLVYAYQLADLELTRSVTDATGEFLFDDLPAGLYKIIAFKPGFVPTVVRLARGSATMEQFLEVQLESSSAETDGEGGFWSVREQIPPDVLRELTAPRLEAAASTELATLDPRMVGPLQGTMSVLTGVEQRPGGESPMTRGRIDLATQVRDLTLGLTGDVWLLGATGFGDGTAPRSTGASNAFALEVRSESDAAVVVSSQRDRLESSLGEHKPIDMQNVQVNWSQPIGSNGQSELVARYTEEENFYRRGLTTALPLPQGSQSWYVEGNYTTPLTERTTMQAGVRYRTHDTVYAHQRILPIAGPVLAESRVDLYGQGGMRLKPGTLLEYGMVSSLEDGQLALAPRVGTVLDLGSDWQASAVVSHKLDDGDPLVSSAFYATHHDDLDGCDQVEEHCYQVALSRQTQEGDGFSLTATDRRFSEALRLYFDDEFFRQLDSLYLVEGDRLPEVRFTLTRRLTPSILTRFTASGGSGGGGETTVAGRWRWQRYENRAQFLVTSVETRFERTDTGVVLRFQQLSQELRPLVQAGMPSRQGEIESLQLLLSQDLNALLQLAAQWAIELDVEVSRGDLNQVRTVDASELYRRFTGGIAVRF